MKMFYTILTISLSTLFFTACGGGNSSSSSSTPTTRTINLHVEQASTLSAISNATVTVYNTAGTQINSSNIYNTNATGDVSVVVTGSDTTYNVKVQASSYTDQVKVLALSSSAATINETISLLPIGSTLSSAIVGLNVDPSGSGAQVDTTGAIFKDDTGAVIPVASIDFTPLNPIANPSAFPGTPDITMPGGTPGLMVSAGMIDIVFKDASGNVLTLASPTTVKIRMPLYSALDPINGGNLVPGNSVRFWSMDPNTGTWVNETNANVVTCSGSPTGLCAEGDVSHFSWWNTDFAISATRKDSIVINSDTNQPFNESDIESIKLLAKFTEAVAGASRYGTTAIRSTYLEVDDFINVGDNFDAKFTVEILFKDGTRATKVFVYTWAEINALSEFRFELSKTDQFVDIDISTYEDSYSAYRTYPLYIRRTFIGISQENVDMKVNGILNGNTTVGTTSCGYDVHDMFHYCTYTKGTQSGDITITSESKLDSTISDSITIDVKPNTLSLALKSNYKGRQGSGDVGYSHIYYQDTSIYLHKNTLQNATLISDYEYSLYGGLIDYKLVLDPAESIPLTDYTFTIECLSSTGSACATNEEFTSPFTFDVSKLPATVNRSNKYKLVAVKNSDSSIRTELKVFYY